MSLIFHNDPERAWCDHFNTEDEINSFINERRFIELTSRDFFNELELQSLILDNLSELLHDDFICILASPNISRRNISDQVCQPDLILIRKDFKKWFIVEVELKNNSFEAMHRQIDTFVNCDISDPKSFFDYLKKKLTFYSPYINFVELEKMIASAQPEVILMADHIRSSWREKLIFEFPQLIFMTFQVYESEGPSRRRYLRINNINDLRLSVEFVKCIYSSVSKTLSVPVGFKYLVGIPIGTAVTISFEGFKERWVIADVYKNKYVLEYQGIGIPLPSSVKNYFLHKNQTIFQLRKTQEL